MLPRVDIGGQFAVLSSENRLFYGTIQTGYAVEVKINHRYTFVACCIVCIHVVLCRLHLESHQIHKHYFILTSLDNCKLSP